MGNIDNKPVQKGRNTLREYFAVNEVFHYFFRVFRKDANGKPNFNLRMMHGINRISILMFLFAFVIWLAKRLFF